MRYTEPYTIFKRTLKSGKSVYYYRYRLPDNSLSSGFSTGCTDFSKAKRFCQKLYNQGAFNVFPSMTFEVYSKDFFGANSKYLNWKKSNGNELEPNTVDAYNCKLKYQLLPFFAKYEIQKINKDTVKQWVIWASSKWASKTINNAQSVLGIILAQAVDEKLIVSNPVLGLEYRQIHKKNRKLLTIDELRQIYYEKWHSDIQRNAYLLACITGMREGEICGLTPKDVKQDSNGFYYLDVTKSNKEHGVGSTKTDVSRIVPIPSEILPKLDLSKEWLFEYKGDPMPPHNLYNSFMRKCQKIGIDTKARGITFHTLRNFFTSYCEKKSIVQYKIDVTTGHKDRTQTDWYTYWTSDMFQEIYEAQTELIGEILCQD